MKTVGIIPARYASKRFPGKPLAILGDRPVIQWVYEAAKKSIDDVVVATDDVRIAHAVEAFGGRAVITSDQHRSGTSRVREAYLKYAPDADIVVNIQGDEPFIRPQYIDSLIGCFDARDVDIATLIVPFNPKHSLEYLHDPNNVKVVIDHQGAALYFSRSVIPYVRDHPAEQWLQWAKYYIHIGVYAFRAQVLKQVIDLPPSHLEAAESLEQLRWLQHGYNIRTHIVDAPTIGIDTPADLEKAKNLI